MLSGCLRHSLSKTKSVKNHAKPKMAITLQPFVRFTSFNFWLVALDLFYNFLQVAGGRDP